jgi:hypothetical protein
MERKCSSTVRSTVVTPLLWNSFIIAGERDIGHRDNMFAA